MGGHAAFARRGWRRDSNQAILVAFIIMHLGKFGEGFDFLVLGWTLSFPVDGITSEACEGGRKLGSAVGLVVREV